MEIRAEKPEDIPAIHRLNVAAFGRDGEANLVDQLRGITSTFSFVAIQSEHIVGHIFLSPVMLAGECGDDLLLLGLAPVAVLPEYQRKGIGSGLIQWGLQACARCGCKAVIVLGSPAYYSRFGFIPAQQKGLSCEFNVPDEAFMVLELQDGALVGCRGIIQYQPEFSQLEPE